MKIPAHGPYTKGDNDTICGYCTKQALSAAENGSDLNPLDAMELW
ncbi:hypothetical protein [Halorarum salinum]|nr:hypothetical protein [Halobaculum salinum]